MRVDRSRPSSKQGLSPARIGAYKALRHMDEHDSYAQDALARFVDGSAMSASDRAFATRLVLGVTSAVGVLDDIINSCLSSPDDIRSDVRCALRVSVYEIAYLHKSAHAAVDQGVELVAYVAPPARRLANAVLRKAVRACATFPYGDPKTDLAAFARACALPLWIVEYSVASLGENRARPLLSSSMDPSPVYAFVNSLRYTDKAFEASLNEWGIEYTSVSVCGITPPGCYRIVDRKALAHEGFLKLIEEGCVLISDASAQCVAYIAAICAADACKRTSQQASSKHTSSERTDAPKTKAAPSFLELCSGRATKTVMIQSDMNRLIGSQIADYVTLDNLEFKSKILKERCETYGVHVDAALTGDATDLDASLGTRTFDCVFIDAPCSGLGTLRRHPEIRWKVTPEKIQQSAKCGLSILRSASSHVKCGGRIIYATCTYSPHENEMVIRDFLESDVGSAFSLVALGDKPFFQQITSADGPDCHFCAVLSRKPQD